MNARGLFGSFSVLLATVLTAQSVKAQQYQYPLGGGRGGGGDGGYSMPGTGTAAQPPARSIPGTGTAAQPPSGSIPGTTPGSAWPADTPSYYPDVPPQQFRSIPGSAVPAEPFYPPPQSSQWRLGIQARGGTPGVEPGVYVEYVYPNSPAERMGIEARDYIVQINGQSIQSMDDLRRATAWSQGHARILVLDHRTHGYMWHTGSLH